jgi:hypothetical protein
MKEQDLVFNNSIRISNLDCMNRDAVWPMGIEVCVTKFPIRNKDGYDINLVKNFCKKLKSFMSPNGIVFLICYAPTECKSRPFELAHEMTSVGFNHIDNIIIEKTWIPGKKVENMLSNSHDYVFMFCNGDIWNIDKNPIKQYLMQNDDKNIGNVWLVETGMVSNGYSEDLSDLLLRYVNLLPGSLIFDPFMGNISIIKSCLKLGHSLVGFETKFSKISEYKKIISDHKSNNILYRKG